MHAHQEEEKINKVIETFFLHGQRYAVFYPFHYATEIIFSAYGKCSIPCLKQAFKLN